MELRRNLITRSSNNSNNKFPYLNIENSSNGFQRNANNNKNLLLNNIDSNSIKSPILKNQENDSRIINLRNNSVGHLGLPNSNSNSNSHTILNLDNQIPNLYRTEDKILKNSSITYIRESNKKYKNYVVQKSQNLFIPPTVINYPPYKENIFSLSHRYKADIKPYYMNNNDYENKEMEILEEVLEKEHYVAGLFYVTNKMKKIDESNENLIIKVKSMEEKYTPLIEQTKDIFKIITQIYEFFKKEEYNPNSNANTNSNLANNNSRGNFNNINGSSTLHPTSNISKVELNNNSKFDWAMRGNGIMKSYKTKKGGINLTFPTKNDVIKNVYLANNSKTFGNKEQINPINIVNISNTLMNSFNNINSNTINNFNKTCSLSSNNINTASSCNVPNDEFSSLIRKIEPFLVKQFTKEPTK